MLCWTREKKLWEAFGETRGNISWRTLDHFEQTLQNAFKTFWKQSWKSVFKFFERTSWYLLDTWFISGRILEEFDKPTKESHLKPWVSFCKKSLNNFFQSLLVKLQKSNNDTWMNFKIYKIDSEFLKKRSRNRYRPKRSVSEKYINL